MNAYARIESHTDAQILPHSPNNFVVNALITAASTSHCALDASRIPMVCLCSVLRRARTAGYPPLLRRARTDARKSFSRPMQRPLWGNHCQAPCANLNQIKLATDDDEWWHGDGDDDDDGDDCRSMQMFLLEKNTWWHNDGDDDGDYD